MKAEAFALLLEAISLVETGGDPRVRGKAGERGRFQMMPALVTAWGGYGEREAAKHLRWIERQLIAKHVDPQPFNLLLAWNAGVERATTGRAPECSYDYARRVLNTFDSLAAARVERAAEPRLVSVREAAGGSAWFRTEGPSPTNGSNFNFNIR